MQGTEQRFSRSPHRTQPWAIPATRPHAGAVGLLKVIVVGSQNPKDHSVAQASPSFSATLRDPRPHSSVVSCATPPERSLRANDDWRPERWLKIAGVVDGAPAALQATLDADADAAALRAFSLAPTLQALPVAPHIAEPRPVREPPRLRLRTDITSDDLGGQPNPRRLAHAAAVMPRGVATAPPGNRLARAWALWLRQPPHVVIGAAATLSALSLLAAGLLVP